jgi:hypothetical protein
LDGDVCAAILAGSFALCGVFEMNAVTVEHESSIWERLMIDPEWAHAVLSMHFSAADEERMRALMDKNNREILSTNEQAEMEAFRRVGSQLAIMQAKARLHLKQSKDSEANGT